MLEKRLKEYRSYSRLVPRSQELLSLEGWYELGLGTPMYQTYLRERSKLSFSKWLTKAGFSSDVVSRLCKQQAEATQKIKISCRFNDIFRMSNTRHFIACTKAGRLADHIPSMIASDPNAAIVFSPDKAGHFQGRAVVIVKDKKVKILRCYGTIRFELLKQFFEQRGYWVEPWMDDTVEWFECNPRFCEDGALAGVYIGEE